MADTFPPRPPGVPSLDDDRPSVDTARLSIDEDAHEIARQLKGLQKIVNKVRLYGVGHEQSGLEAVLLLQQITPLLDELDTLQFDVTADSLDLAGLPIVTDPDHAGIADNLYRDGIRELILKNGLTSDELLQLLQILGTNFYLPQHDEDTLQSLLWTASLPHVDYESIRGIEEAIEDSEDAARGENLDFHEICRRILASPEVSGARGAPLIGGRDHPDAEPMAPDLPPDEGEDRDTRGEGDAAGQDVTGGDAGRSPPGPGGPSDTPSASPMGGSGEVSSLASDQTSALGAIGRFAAHTGATTGVGERRLASLDTVDFLDGKRDDLDVPADDLIALWDEADNTRYSVLLARVVDILIHHDLRAGETLPRTAPLVMTCVEFAAEAGLTSQVRSAVDSVSSLLTRTPTDDEIRVGSAMMRQLLDVRLLLRVAAAADHDDPGTAEDLDHILALGGVDLALLLLDEIVDVEPGPLRTYLIERAVTVLGDDPRPLLENLRRLEPSRLGIRLEALALTPSMAARDQLIAILDHADPNIRRIVVELIPDDALRHLWKRMALMLVGDRDPQVRCAILERMERGRFPAITQVLTQMVTAESFHDRAPQEKRLALEILVRTAGESSVQVMAGLLNLKVGMMARRTAETRTLAALALGWIGSSAARTELTRAARSWDPGLRKAGKDGLQVIERRRS